MQFDSECCRKYSDLTEEEISFLQEYSLKMQDMADEARSDVFIDAKTSTGKSGLVIAQAKPGTTKSAYNQWILGMIIKWQDEPAVERTFRTEAPTVGLKALVYSPEIIQVIQSVFPIFYHEKVIAVLIEETLQFSTETRSGSGYGVEETFRHNLDLMQEGVILADENKTIVYCNRPAEELFSKIGYVSNLVGMPLHNFWTVDLKDEENGIPHLAAIGRYTLKGVCHKLDAGIAKYMLTLEDLTEVNDWKNQCLRLKIAHRETRHQIKNSLHLVSDILNRKSSKESMPEVQLSYQEAAVRIRSILVTLEEGPNEDEEKVPVKAMLHQLCSELAFTFAPVQIQLNGDEFQVSGSHATAISMTVNELIYNALKHAFENSANGLIKVYINKGVLMNTISVEDNGRGFSEPDPQQRHTGLELVQSLVEDRLDGELRITSGPQGTRVEFDFME